MYIKNFSSFLMHCLHKFRETKLSIDVVENKKIKWNSESNFHKLNLYALICFVNNNPHLETRKKFWNLNIQIKMVK